MESGTNRRRVGPQLLTPEVNVKRTLCASFVHLVGRPAPEGRPPGYRVYRMTQTELTTCHDNGVQLVSMPSSLVLCQRAQQAVRKEAINPHSIH